QEHTTSPSALPQKRSVSARRRICVWSAHRRRSLGASAMSERRWQVFVVRCASCEKTLMTTPLIGAVEIKQFEDHVRSCARHDPLPHCPCCVCVVLWVGGGGTAGVCARADHRGANDPRAFARRSEPLTHAGGRGENPTTGRGVRVGAGCTVSGRTAVVKPVGT